MTGYDLVTMGETMLRLMPTDGRRLGQTDRFEVSFGGAESNVAANLARLGRRSAWFSHLPDNPLGQQLAGMLRGHGVDTSAVKFVAGERLGTYFIEAGGPPRGIRVWYDRKGSAASKIGPADLPQALISQSRWCHLTGISPALSASCHDATLAAARLAQATPGCKLSFDVNYRALLWAPQEAAAVLEPLCQMADVVFVARRDAALLFGVESGSALGTAQALQDRWQGTVFVSDGDQGAFGADAQGVYHAPAYTTEIVDRIGAGDAFASGIIDQLLDGADLPTALRFGAALAALKLSVHGDIAFVNRAEVQTLVQSRSSGLHR